MTIHELFAFTLTNKLINHDFVFLNVVIASRKFNVQ